MRTTAGTTSSTEIPAAAALLVPKLKLLQEAGQPAFPTPRSLVLTNGELELGRRLTGAAPVALEHDPSVSRRHACLRVSDAGRSIHLRDLQSRNGTSVNGRALGSQAVALQDGDVIRIGNTLLLLRYEAVKPIDAPVAELYGSAPALAALRERLVRCATDPSPVCIFGETGTGKERAAIAVHRLSRRKGLLESVNCGGKIEQLAADDFLGHVPGAYTGALQPRRGHFLAADGGSLFLDEVAELPLALQPLLLRVLQDGQVQPLGGGKPCSVNVRLICATNRDLAAEVRAGRFREDLFWRLCYLRLDMPALRQRREDILPLLQTLLPRDTAPVPARLGEALLCHAFPGNIRELQSLAAQLSTGGPEPVLAALAACALQPGDGRTSSPTPAPRPRPRQPTLGALEAALRATGGIVSQAARRLGLPRPRIYRLCAQHGLDPNDYREDRSRSTVP